MGIAREVAAARWARGALALGGRERGPIGAVGTLCGLLDVWAPSSRGGFGRPDVPHIHDLGKSGKS